MIWSWILSTDIAEGDCGEFACLLSDAEKERAARYRFERDRVRSIVTRASLRLLLGHQARCDPSYFRFDTNSWGKPMLPDPQNVYFNVSHSGDYTIIGFSQTGNLGVDIELMRPEIEVEALAKRVFCAAEKDWLIERTGEERIRGFYQLWTLKEAVLKAHGTGLSLDPREIRIAFDGDEITVQSDAFGDASWLVADVAAPRCYSAAIAFGAADDLRTIDLTGAVPSAAVVLQAAREAFG